ncbi:30S ribosomal protein S18 [Candidatus Beckwithbacteria bacterium RBG_13_42_9]|uniref:Small ribosomal subunit protein bS18 n=1 Tax=Candidatus Beckwithbacteria bacterium RBG_13_42_9 TaxID=1797457 RepID=A0A1F5E882_9BACT|nr:MAG: 30S ribosomal protein S18 [Candidatus Beckwithbacteria bacterium RBG_13_42_9]
MRKRLIFKRIVPPGNCPFCKGKIEPGYKEPEVLAKYITDKGNILDKTQTGICAKHQRRLTIAIKRARHLALLPFVAQVN